MAKKFDWFKADKDMAVRVQDFILKKGEFITLKTRRAAEISGLKAKLARLLDPEVVVMTAEKSKREQDIAALEAELAAVKDEYDELLAANAKFEYTDLDKALYKSYKDAENNADVEQAIVNWFTAYNASEIANTEALCAIMAAVSGEKWATARIQVNSGGTVFLGKRSRDDFLKVFYGRTAELMIAAGTLKTYNFPADIRAKYAPKERKTK